MEDEKKTKKQLIEELNELRQSVSELKGFAEEVKQSRVNQEKFTKAFLQNSIPTIITSVKDSSVVEVSDAFLRLVGLKRHEIIGHTAVKGGFITKEQREFFFNELNKNGHIENIEMEVSLGNGELRHGLFNSVMISINNEICALTTIQDITARKQAESQMNDTLEALQASEGRYRALFDNSFDCVYTHDLEGNFIDANDSTLKLLGYSSEDIRGINFASLLSEDQLPLAFKAVQELQKTGFQKNLAEFRLQSKNGTDVYVETIGSTISSKGTPTIIQSVARDITKRRQADKELRESDERFRILFNSGKDYLAVHLTGKDGQPGHFIQVNDAACEILGYTREEMLKLTHQDVDSARSSGQMPALIEKLIENKHILYETEIVTKNGDRIPMEVSLNLFSLNGNQATMCVARNITERKLAEEILAKLQEKYRLIAENIMDCIALVSKEGIIQYVSNSLELLGYEPEELINLKGLSITHPDNMEQIKTIWRQGIENAWREITFEMKVRHKNGHYIQMSFRGRTLFDLHGEVMGGFFMARFAEQQQAEITLLDQKSPYNLNDLSPREKEILSWVMEGKSTWDIAKIIDIAESTVKFHIDKIMKKLNAANRTHAVVIAIRNDLLN